eukprot:sb/3476992/
MTKRYKVSSALLDEKQEQLKTHKDEIRILRMTIDSYESKLTDQSRLITRLQKELTDVKGNRNVMPNSLTAMLLPAANALTGITEVIKELCTRVDLTTISFLVTPDLPPHQEH